MAIYSKIHDDRPIVNGMAVICPGDIPKDNYMYNPGSGYVQSWDDIDGLTFTTNLDGCYKVGPSGTWENWGG